MDYLGQNISKLLEAEPFIGWTCERSVTDEDVLDPGYDYIFDKHGLEISCDLNDYIRTIFLHANSYGGADISLTEVPFSFRRHEVLEYFQMSPEKSGDGFVDPILGEFGGHDRFRLPKGVVHVQYKAGKDEIEQITLMRADTFSNE